MSNGLIFIIALFFAFIIYPPFMGVFAGLVLISLLTFFIGKILSAFS